MNDPDLKNDAAWGDLTSSILSDFDWNLHSSDPPPPLPLPPPPHNLKFDSDSKPTTTVPPSSSAAAAASTSVTEVFTSSNHIPSATSSSSEDPAENSTSTAAQAQTPPPKKEKKKAQKRIRQQRFAFMTKSDVDNLEDGYRWRKYGQKAVKNSPFPRSYYRCTNSRCTVKKRVERSSEDPSIVITTYEGQHCHQTIGFPRGGILTAHHDPHSFTSPHHHHHHLPPPLLNPYYYQQLHHQLHRDNTPSPQLPQSTTTTEDAHAVSTPSEEGLLGDIVPHTMRNP